ncbi:MAG: hypothetical protein DME24_06800, partial [Verrucomicrobia bacterium]
VAVVQQKPAGKVVLTGLSGLSDFVAKASPELAANAMLCAANQAAYLLHRQLQSQGRAFLKEGGFTERLRTARTLARSSAQAARSETPRCPTCGKPMFRRTAKTGSRSGLSFWGCSAFPDCKGTRPLTDRTSQTSLAGPSSPTH